MHDAVPFFPFVCLFNDAETLGRGVICYDDVTTRSVTSYGSDHDLTVGAFIARSLDLRFVLLLPVRDAIVLLLLGTSTGDGAWTRTGGTRHLALDFLERRYVAKL